jgi:selenoprotein W-related protein
LAAELKQEFPDIDARLIPSSGGVFEVELDGHLVFSKKAKGRHAEPGEVVQAVRRARQADTRAGGQTSRNT